MKDENIQAAGSAQNKPVPPVKGWGKVKEATPTLGPVLGGLGKGLLSGILKSLPGGALLLKAFNK